MNIRQLALDTVAQIRAQQHWYTAPSRKRALNQFEAFLNTNPVPTSQAIIDEAKRVKNNVEQTGWFGWNGKAGSSFLKGFNNFLSEAYAQLENFRLEEVKNQKLKTCELNARTTSKKVLNELTQKLKPTAEILDAEAFIRPIDPLRIKLEDNITNALSKHYPLSHELNRWKSHLHGTRNGINDIHIPCFEIKKLHPEVRTAIDAYDKFIKGSGEYILKHRKISINNSKLEDERNKLFNHAELRRDTRMNRLALGVTTNDDLDREAHEEARESRRVIKH